MGAHRVREALLASLQDYADALTDLVRILIEDPRSICAGCPLAQWYGSRKVMAMRLENAGRVYGVLVVSVPGEVDVEDMERNLLKEVAGDIALTLKALELEEEAKRAEEAHRTLVQNSLQGLAIIQDGRVVFANPALAEISGYTVEELLALSPEEVEAVVHPEDRERVLKTMRERLAGKEVPARQEFRVLRKDGSVRWLETLATRVEYRGRPALQVAYMDITERKRAEERQAKLVQRLTVLHRASQEIIQALQDPERVYEAVHRAVAELMPAEAFVVALKISEEEAEAVYLFDKGGRYPSQKIPKGQGLTWHILSTGKSLFVRDLLEESIPAIHFGTEEPVRSILAVPLRAGEEIIGMLSTQSYQPGAFSEEDLDLLELLAAYVASALRVAQLLSALRESEARFRRLAENAPDIIFRYRLKPTPGFEYISPAVTRISGYTPEEHYADPDLIRKIVHPEDQSALEALGQGEGLFEKPREFRWIHKNGHTVWTEQTNVPIRDEAGNIVAIEGIVRDITERKRLELERLARAQAIENALLQFVDALSSAVELRDPYTSGHQRRVAALACAIAEEMGLSAEEIQVIRVAALLHDIGKALFVPIEILSKPGKLTDLEMALIREHPKAGYEILRKVEFPWPVAEIVYQHHERLDGSGYPRGLKGEEILLEARIIAVADVVEAMSSHRPYRPALGVDEALAEIRKNAGKLYDPKVVEACIRVFAKGFTFPR